MTTKSSFSQSVLKLGLRIVYQLVNDNSGANPVPAWGLRDKCSMTVISSF